MIIPKLFLQCLIVLLLSIITSSQTLCGSERYKSNFPSTVKELVTISTNSNIIFVLLDNGYLYRSINGGRNFTDQTTALEGFNSAVVSSIKIITKSANDTFVFFAGGQEFWYTNDGGETYHYSLSSGLMGEFFKLLPHPFNPNLLAAISLVPNYVLIVSIDAGQNWNWIPRSPDILSEPPYLTWGPAGLPDHGEQEFYCNFKKSFANMQENSVLSSKTIFLQNDGISVTNNTDNVKYFTFLSIPGDDLFFIVLEGKKFVISDSTLSVSQILSYSNLPLGEPLKFDDGLLMFAHENPPLDSYGEIVFSENTTTVFTLSIGKVIGKDLFQLPSSSVWITNTYDSQSSKFVNIRSSRSSDNGRNWQRLNPPAEEGQACTSAQGVQCYLNVMPSQVDPYRSFSIHQSFSNESLLLANAYVGAPASEVFSQYNLYYSTNKGADWSVFDSSNPGPKRFTTLKNIDWILCTNFSGSGTIGFSSNPGGPINYCEFTDDQNLEVLSLKGGIANDSVFIISKNGTLGVIHFINNFTAPPNAPIPAPDPSPSPAGPSPNPSPDPSPVGPSPSPSPIGPSPNPSPNGPSPNPSPNGPSPNPSPNPSPIPSSNPSPNGPSPDGPNAAPSPQPAGVSGFSVFLCPIIFLNGLLYLFFQ